MSLVLVVTDVETGDIVHITYDNADFDRFRGLLERNEPIPLLGPVAARPVRKKPSEITFTDWQGLLVGASCHYLRFRRAGASDAAKERRLLDAIHMAALGFAKALDHSSGVPPVRISVDVFRLEAVKMTWECNSIVTEIRRALVPSELVE